MGEFDDLIPARKPRNPGKRERVGEFDDLVPYSGAPKDNLGAAKDYQPLPDAMPEYDDNGRVIRTNPFAAPVERKGFLAELGSIVSNAFERGSASTLATGLHSGADFIDQTIQAPLRRTLGELGLPGFEDPLGAAGLAEESLGVEREINADRAKVQQEIGGRPSLKELGAHPLESARKYSLHLANAGAESLPAFVGAIALRNPELAAGALGATTGAQTYTDMRADGVGRGEAARAGVINAGIETAGEAMGLPFVMGKSGKGSLLKAMLSEGGQEMPVQLAQQYVEDQTTGNETPILQQLGDALDAGLVGAGLGAGGHGLSVAVDKATGNHVPTPTQAPNAAPRETPADAPMSTAIDPALLAAGNAALGVPAEPTADLDAQIDAQLLRNVPQDDAPVSDAIAPDMLDALNAALGPESAAPSPTAPPPPVEVAASQTLPELGAADGPAPERPELVAGGRAGDAALLADLRSNQAGDGAGEAAGVPAELGQRAQPGTNEAAGAQAQEVTKARAPLNVRMGDQEFPVDSIEDASAKFIQLRDQKGDIGGMKAVELIDQQGRPVGFIGHNGEVYDKPLGMSAGSEPVYRPNARPYGERAVDGEAERVGTTALPDTAPQEDGINGPRPPRYSALDLRQEIGWSQRGGEMVRAARDPAELNEDERNGIVPIPPGEVIGRTRWTGWPNPQGEESTFWKNRPDKNLSEKAAQAAMDKFERGEPLRAIEQRFIDHAHATAQDYEQAAQFMEDADRGYSEIERQRGMAELREQHAIDVAEADHAEALGLYELVQQAAARGADEIDLAQSSNESPQAYAARLWKLTQEPTRGTDTRATAEDRAGGNQGREGGQAGVSEGFAIGEPAKPAAAQEVARPSAGLFGAPTAREVVDAAQRDKDAKRDGKTGTGRTDMLSGDGELFAGNRPAQADITTPSQQQASPEKSDTLNGPMWDAMSEDKRNFLFYEPSWRTPDGRNVQAKAKNYLTLPWDRLSPDVQAKLVAAYELREVAHGRRPAKPAPSAEVGAIEQVEELTPADLTPAENASLARQRYGFGGSDGVSKTDTERAAFAVLNREVSRSEGIEDADKLKLREAVNRAIGTIHGFPPITAVYLRGVAGLHGIVREGYIQRLQDQQARRGGTNKTAGLYLSANDTVDGKPRFVLFTDVVRSPLMAAFTAAHEVAGHHGLRALLGDRLNKVLDLADQNPTVKAVADAMALSRKLNANQRHLAVEEALADLAAANATGNWQRIQDKHGVTPSKEMQSKLRAFIANVVRQIKMLFKTRNVGFSDAQVQQLLANAWKAAQGQSASMSVVGANGALEQVSIEVAKRLPIKTQLPSAPAFAEAVANTAGATITPDGLEIDLVRYQKPEQTGDTAIRTGVFYLPAGSKDQRHYKGNGKSYGGTDKIEGRTLLRRPLFVKGATGGKAPETAYDLIEGKGAYQRMRSAALAAMPRYGQSIMNGKGAVENFLEEYGGDRDMAYEIMRSSTAGNQLAYALQEHVVAHAVRDAGYDAVVGYGKGKAGPFLSEVFDLREITNPTEDGESDLHPAFESAIGQPQSALESTEDQTQSEAFRNWFGKSVVTEDGKAGGKPLVVYHGTAGEFDEFDPKAPASHIPLPGFFFTPEQEIANEFADGAAHRRKLSGAEPRTIPAFLSIKNPVRLNYSDRTSGRMTSEQTVRGDLNKAKQSGHDGAIITGWADGSGDVQYVAFRPSQIKSATGNNGNFNPDNPSILESVEEVEPFDATTATGESVIRDGRLLSLIDAVKAAGGDLSGIRAAAAANSRAALVQAIDALLPSLRPKPQRVTGTKNAVTEAEREAAGRNPILADAVKSNEATLYEAMRAVKQDPSAGPEAVARLSRGGVEGISLADEAILLVHKTELLNARDAAAKKLADPNASEAAKDVARKEWEASEAQITAIDMAAVNAGREWGRFGQFRQRMLREDFTFAALERKERARLERPLTREESATVKAMADTIAELQGKVDALQARVSNAASESAYEELVRSMARPKKNRPTVEYLRKAANDARARLAATPDVPSRRQQSGAVISPTAFADLAVIGAYHIANGAAKFSDWVGAMKADLGARFDAFRSDHPNIFKAAQKELDKPLKADATAAEVLEKIDLANVQPKDVRKLIEALVGEGLRGEQAVIAAAAEKLELEASDVRSLFVQTSPKAQPTLTETQAELRDLRKLIRLQDEIDRLEAGQPKPARTPQAPDSPAVAARKKELAEVRERLKPVRDPEGRYQEMRGKQIAKRIKELQDRIAAGDFASRPRVPRALNEANQRAMFALDQAKQDFLRHQFEDSLRKRSKLAKVFGAVGDTFNLARAVMTSFDLSAVLRQGGFIAYGHPLRAVSSLGPSLRAFASAQAEHSVKTEIESRQNAPLYAKYGLQLTGIGAGPLTQIEEAYASRWLDKIPAWTGMGLVRGSGRAYTAFLNKLRADSFDAMAASLGKRATLTDAEGKAIANYINVATGRGKIGASENAGQALNTVFFAPRLVASRFQLLAGQPLYGGSASTRKLITLDYARFLMGLGVTISLAAFALGGDDDDDKPMIGVDPRSSDFGKIRIGNTYLDPLAGLAQVSTFIARLATGETVSGAGKVKPLRHDYTLTDLRRALGEDIPAHKLAKDGGLPFGSSSSADVIGRFLRTKLAPVPGAIVNVLTGSNVIGQEVTPAQVAAEMVTPMSFQNIGDVMEEHGVAKGTAITLLGLLGMGIQHRGYANPAEAARADIKERLAGLPVDQWQNAMDEMKAKYGPVLDGVTLETYKRDGKYGAAGEPKRTADGDPVLTGGAQ